MNQKMTPNYDMLQLVNTSLQLDFTPISYILTLTILNSNVFKTFFQSEFNVIWQQQNKDQICLNIFSYYVTYKRLIAEFISKT